MSQNGDHGWDADKKIVNFEVPYKAGNLVIMSSSIRTVLRESSTAIGFGQDGVKA